MKKAVAYLRVSSQGQSDDGFSLEYQIKHIQAYAFANQIELKTEHIFKDIESGSDPMRDDWCKMKAFLLNTNEIDHILVYTVNRWTRDAADGLSFLKELKKKNITLISVSEFFDPKTPQGKFMQTLLHGMAELDKDTLIEKLTRGKNQMIQQTGKWAGGIAPYGYQPIGRRRHRSSEQIINGRGQLIVDSQESDMIKMVFNLRKKKLSYSNIISSLTERGYLNRKGNPFNKATLYRILNRKDVYTSNIHINHSIVLNNDIKPQQPSILDE